MSTHGLAQDSLSGEQHDFFETKIRPVLVAECYECHGGEKQKGGLALHSREALRKGGESGPAVIPGEPEKSLLIQSIRHSDPDLKMPSKAPKLEDRIIADFVAWVKMGAPDPRTAPDGKRTAPANTWPETLAARRAWWCFQPVDSPSVPEPQNSAWSDHPVDRFLLAKMEAKGLTPAAEADPAVLLRRLSFALTGLPPTAEDAERFVGAAAKDRPSAVAGAADRLLGSTAFGERWARHWMDLVRYAETYGSEHDYLNPHAWRYRDYLVRAFNTDLPYDQFAQEQIAGDLLPPRWNQALGINEALLGTAWHRMIESYASPVDVKREEVSIIDWQIESLGKNFLGLTIQCARCHDHKFDPISDEDFYALYGVFASSRPTLNILDDPKRLIAQDETLVRLKEKMRSELTQAWRESIRSWPGAIKLAEKSSLEPLRALATAKDFPKTWAELRARHTAPAASEHIVFADFTGGDLGGWRVSGPGLPEKPSAPGVLSLSQDGAVRAVYPAGFYSDAVSERHGGSLRSPEFIIEKRKVSVLASGAGKARLRLVIENFQNDLLLFEPVNPDLNSATPKWVTMAIKEQWLGRRARIELLTRDDKTCVGEVKDAAAWAAKTDGRSAFGITRAVFHDGSAPPAPVALPAEFWNAAPTSWDEAATRFAQLMERAVSAWVEGRASDEQARLLQAALESNLLSNKPPPQLVSEFRTSEEKIPFATRAPGVRDDGSAYDAALFPRGDHLVPGPTIRRRWLEVLGGAPLGKADSGRLALAKEVTRRENPLTARVMVNRVWQHLFGRGLVATPDNFGRMGEQPTHPELLDHLATKFMEDGWSVKRLVRYLVTSRAWQTSATASERAREVDPNNLLLSHAEVRRLDAEAIRDSMLALGGNLAPGHTGPGVLVFYRTQIEPTYQPPAGPLDGSGRRSLYLEVRRNFPNEFLTVFDFPKPNTPAGRRTETNVPAQSLALLNDPFVRHQAGLWGKRVAGLESTDDQRIRRMYLEAFARPPTNEELGRAVAFLNDEPSDPWREFAHACFLMKEFTYPQ